MARGFWYVLVLPAFLIPLSTIMDNLTSQLQLSLYLKIKSRLRRYHEALLKRHKMKWSDWEELEDSAADQIPDEGIDSDGYHFTVHKTAIRVFREGRIIGERKHISTHKL